MQIGMMGLGRMGANMVRRLMRDGHECVVYDINPAVAALARTARSGRHRSRNSSASSPSRARLADAAGGDRGTIVDSVAALLEPGDIIIDGGNSYYRDDVDRARALPPRASTTSMSARAAASGASIAATA